MKYVAMWEYSDGRYEMFFGPTTLDEAIRHCERMNEDLNDSDVFPYVQERNEEGVYGNVLLVDKGNPLLEYCFNPEDTFMMGGKKWIFKDAWDREKPIS